MHPGELLPNQLLQSTSGHDWYDDEFDYDGPACYELGTGGPRGGQIEPHYVGETVSEKRRMSSYARDGSHLSDIIDDHLKGGWTLYYRAVACSSKHSARKLQDNLLRKFEYDWNIQLNGVDDYD